MRFLDLFSGIGGFRLGMEQAGHECVGHVEIDKYANISYTAIHKPKEGEFFANDIRGVDPELLPEADIYCGGFPCQSFSIAGKRGGFEDTRGTLFFEIMRLAKIRKPSYLFLENVKGLLSHDGGKTFGTILRSLWECGYDAQWQVLNSKNYGIGHSRERVFIVGYLRGECQPEIFPLSIKSNGTHKTICKLGPFRGNIEYPNGISNTITKSYGMESGDSTKVFHQGKIRLFTSLECWRLQGFPDWTHERAKQAGVSESQRYKQTGNSVTVNVIYEIAQRLEQP